MKKWRGIMSLQSMWNHLMMGTFISLLWNWWSERFSPHNHNPHFPYFVTHYTDSMPICSFSGSLYDVLFDPKWARKTRTRI